MESVYTLLSTARDLLVGDPCITASLDGTALTISALWGGGKYSQTYRPEEILLTDGEELISRFIYKANTHYVGLK